MGWRLGGHAPELREAFQRGFCADKGGQVHGKTVDAGCTEVDNRVDAMWQIPPLARRYAGKVAVIHF